jgi:hypothetical protein
MDSPPYPVSQLAVDPQNPAIVWEMIDNFLRKTTDGGVG